MIPLTVAIVPLNIVWADRQANLKAVDEALNALRPGVDVVLLPELFSTGFVADPDVYPSLAETDLGPTLEHLRKRAAEKRLAIAGSLLACNQARTEYYNRGFFIEPTGETTYVNKRHLFHVSTEAQLLTGGREPYAVARYRGCNIALGICYDLRFPVWCRNTMNHGRYAYDLFLLPANWPQKRAVALEALSQARAIENQAYMVVGNRSGSDEYGDYDGLSFAWDYIGTRLCTAQASETAYFTTDPEGLKKLREYMPAGLDSDEFEIKW